MFDRTGRCAAASSEAARRRLELLGVSLSGELAASGLSPPEPAELSDAELPDAPDADAAPSAAVRPAGPGRHAARPLSRSARVTAGLADRVPVPVRAGWSTRLSAHHVAVVAVLVATALCLAAWWALSARPQVQAMPRMSPITSGPISPAATPSTSPEAAGSVASTATTEDVVVVDVAGRVRRPGIVTLPLGSRVADALEAAGGTRAEVDLSTLNLARVLADGEQLLVGVEAAVPPATATESVPGTPTALVNLNTATETELDVLPGVGPVTAQAILAWRTEHGGFTSVDELLEVSGIGEVTLEELRPLVTV